MSAKNRVVNSIGTGPAKENFQKFAKFDPLIKQPVINEKINVYQTTADGLRFAFKQIDFNSPMSDSNHVKLSVTLDLKKTRQVINGFGGAFTDAACENLMKVPKKIRQEIIDDYFHPENGLEYTLGRTTIGGSDFSYLIYTLDDTENDYELKNFSLAPEDIDYKIPIIKQAMNYVPDIKIIATSWSPPIWLKTNKKINRRGTIVGKVTEKSFVTYANYLVKFLNAYLANGIKIWGISPANEPTNGKLIPYFPFNCVGFSADQMRDFIVETLGPILSQNGYGKENLKLFIVDDQRIHLNKWVRTIMSHPKAKEYVTHVAFHWYFNSIVPARILDKIKGDHPDLDIWSTEACTGSYSLFHRHVELGSYSRAEQYAKDISEDLNHQTSAWIDWNLALDLNGGPNWSSNFVDSPIIIDIEEQKYIRQPMFYAIAHFSKFIKPNSLNLEKDISVKGKTGWFSSSIHSSSFKTPDNDLVTVITNPLRSNVKVTIQVQENKNQIINYILPEKSITTFVWKI